jgi:hypothetical protein
MPLSAPAERQHLHTRRVTCQGFFRSDGLFDIEGRITDEKTYPQDNDDRGTLEAGDYVHNMWIRLTVDLRMTIVDVEATTDSSPYRICPEITPNFKRLIGLRIAGGFHREVKARLGGVHGCTHLVELLGPVATTAFQTISSDRATELHEAHQANAAKLRREESGQARPEAGTRPKRPPAVLNTCHAWRADGEVVRRWAPDFYTGAGTARDAAETTEADRAGQA